MYREMSSLMCLPMYVLVNRGMYMVAFGDVSLPVYVTNFGAFRLGHASTIMCGDERMSLPFQLEEDSQSCLVNMKLLAD